MGLKDVRDKTKDEVASRQNGNMADPIVGGYTFRAVNYFKYFGVKYANGSNNIHNEIILGLSSANEEYFELVNSNCLIYYFKD